MPELATDFQTLSAEYQAVLRLAQETHGITIAPLQLPERLRDEAEKLRAQIEAQLEVDRYKAAWEAGQRQRLADVVTQILH